MHCKNINVPVFHCSRGWGNSGPTPRHNTMATHGIMHDWNEGMRRQDGILRVLYRELPRFIFFNMPAVVRQDFLRYTIPQFAYNLAYDYLSGFGITQRAWSLLVAKVRDWERENERYGVFYRRKRLRNLYV